MGQRERPSREGREGDPALVCPRCGAPLWVPGSGWEDCVYCGIGPTCEGRPAGEE
ncbi:MAG: hypothetical protein OWV35_10540 [Firmicutes bacterium]|nr:hypothetical protein [Bacillota bacterium]